MSTKNKRQAIKYILIVLFLAFTVACTNCGGGDKKENEEKFGIQPDGGFRFNYKRTYLDELCDTYLDPRIDFTFGYPSLVVVVSADKEKQEKSEGIIGLGNFDFDKNTFYFDNGNVLELLARKVDHCDGTITADRNKMELKCEISFAEAEPVINPICNYKYEKE